MVPPRVSTSVRRSATRPQARRASEARSPDHAARSSGVAGPWAPRYREASSARAPSPSRAWGSLTQSRSRTNVGRPPRGGPKQHTPRAAASQVRWAIAWPSVRTPCGRSRSAISARVRGPSAASMSSIRPTARSAVRHATPSSASRRRAVGIAGATVSGTSQPTSSTEIRWMVPRMAHVRTTERSSSRAPTRSARVTRLARARTASSAASGAWAWIPTRWRTTSAGDRRPGLWSSCAAIRILLSRASSIRSISAW
jgi:hypothetical protein